MTPLERVEITDEALGLKGYLVIDRLNSGLCAGGIRMTSGVSLAQLEQLAHLMTLKFSLVGVHLGGAKAGIVASPGSADDIARLLNRAAELLEPYLRSCYLAGEDLGTRAGDIGRMYQHIGFDPAQLAREKMAAIGVTLPARPAGERPDLFTEAFAGRIAGRGVAEAAIAAAELLGLKPCQLRASIQGFGSVGLASARELARLGVTIVAVADLEGTLCAPGGLDLDDLERARDQRGIIDRRRLRHAVTLLRRDDWYRTPVELLVPAAVENAITLPIVDRLKPTVRLVVEAANGPVTDDAEAALEARGIAIVPDFVASAGSAAAFGLLITGQASSPDEAVAESCRRIAAATRNVVSGATSGATARERARRLALGG
jgi:glutamate dehydrogenase (NAD(P)+)